MTDATQFGVATSRRLAIGPLVFAAMLCVPLLESTTLAQIAPFGTSEWRYTGATNGLIDSAYGPATMAYGDGAGGATSVNDFFTTTSAAGIPDIGGVDASVMFFAARSSNTEGYQVRTGLDGGSDDPPGSDPNGIEQWTMIFDMYIDPANNDSYLGIWNGNASNTNDAELFLRPDEEAFWTSPSGTAAAGAWSKGVWNRFVVVNDYADTSTVQIYVNGNTTPVFDGAVSDYVYDGDPDPFWFLTDNTPGETSSGYIANYAFAPTLLTPDDVATLGEAQADGIYEGPAAFLPVLNIVVDRDSGSIVIENNTGQNQDIKGYSILSEDGALIEENWISVAGNYDASGSGAVDIDDNWVRFTAAGATGDLSEGSLGTGTLAAGQSVPLSGEGGAWLPYYREELSWQYLDGSGGVVTGFIDFTGNSDASYALADLNFDGLIDGADWEAYVAGLGGEFADLSIAQAYRHGDLNGDLVNGYADFRLFAAAYDAANGAGAFAALLSSVPEPGSGMLLVLCCGLGVCVRRRRAAVGCGSGPRSRSVFRAALAPLTGVIVLATASSGSAITAPVGTTEWRYTGATDGLIDSAYGPATMAYADGAGGTTAFNDIFTTTSAAGIPDIGGVDASVMFFAARSSNTEGYQVRTGLDGGSDDPPGSDPNGIEQWTMIFDMYIDPANNDSYLGIWNGNASNTNDAELFLRPDEEAFWTSPSGTAAAGAWSKGVWNRFVVVNDYADTSTVQIYVNGNTTPVFDGAVSDYVYDGDPDPFWFLTDNTPGETSSGYIANYAFAPTLLTPDDVATLGEAQADGIYEGPSTLLPVLNLVVDRDSGSISIENNTDRESIDFNFYQILSEGGSLNPDGWNNLDDQNVDAVGSGPGQSWSAGGGSDETELVEAFLLGSSALANGGGVLLRADFDDDNDVDGDDFLRWQTGFGTTSGAERIDGDANGDGDVDGDDFLVWQAEFGSESGGSLSLGAAYDSGVDAQDLEFLYGRPSGALVRGTVRYVGGGNGALATPEPDSLVLCLLSFLLAFPKRTRESCPS